MTNTGHGADLPRLARSILSLSERLGALRFGDFKLTSGEASAYYFDGRLVTLDPEGSYLVAAAFLPVLRELCVEAVAGPAVAAVPMVSALALLSHIEEGSPLGGLIVRPEAKAHGTGKRIEGAVRAGARVAVVDDTCSTGGSLIDAVDAVEAAGCTVVKVMCILDRNMGGSDAIRQRGYDFLALLEADEGGRIRPPSDDRQP